MIPIRDIPVDRIRVVNPRAREKRKYAEIVDSIAKVGLKKPITVTPAGRDPDGTERFNLVCGQGRLEAFQSLGQKTIPAFIRSYSSEETMIASLVENIARNRGSVLEQVKGILWMREQGDSLPDIALRTGLSETYVRGILNLSKDGEERLLEAVLRGKIPVTIAMKLAGLSDDASQQLLLEAYDSKELNQKTLGTFKRLVEQRKYLGKSYATRRRAGPKRTSADTLVLAYKQETQRQKLMVRKSKLCEAKLLSIGTVFGVLTADEDFLNLLRAENLATMPKFLAERARAFR